MADVGCEISNLESAIYHVPSVFFLLVVSCLLTAFLLNPQSAIFPLPAAFCPLISAPAPPPLQLEPSKYKKNHFTRFYLFVSMR